jgi:hypothetical protein
MSWKYNPFTQELDYFEERDSAKRLEDKKTCAEVISALKIVRAINDTEVVLADNLTYTNCKALGIALQAGNIGTEIDILLLGKVTDPAFTFTINEPLFLTAGGVITSTPPSNNFSVNIGHSLGNGAIFININEPIEL